MERRKEIKLTRTDLQLRPIRVVVFQIGKCIEEVRDGKKQSFVVNLSCFHPRPSERGWLLQRGAFSGITLERLLNGRKEAVVNAENIIVF